MYASEFNYYRAQTLNEVGDLLRQHPGAKILAGGHSLIPLLKLRLASPPALVDIGRVTELKGVAISKDTLRIGAMTTHAEVAASPLVREHAIALAEAAGHVGDPAVRHRGTIGGNVAHADPASDLPIVLTALDARFAVLGGVNTTTFAAKDFFQGMMTTALGEHDLLTAIEVPLARKGCGTAYVKFEHPASRYAVVGVAAVIIVKDGTCTDAAVALGGLVPCPKRATSVERSLVGRKLTSEAIAEASPAAATDVGDDVIGDLYASAEYRRAMAPTYTSRALQIAAGRAR